MNRQSFCSYFSQDFSRLSSSYLVHQTQLPHALPGSSTACLHCAETKRSRPYLASVSRTADLFTKDFSWLGMWPAVGECLLAFLDASRHFTCSTQLTPVSSISSVCLFAHFVRFHHHPPSYLSINGILSSAKDNLLSAAVRLSISKDLPFLK